MIRFPQPRAHARRKTTPCASSETSSSQTGSIPAAAGRQTQTSTVKASSWNVWSSPSAAAPDTPTGSAAQASFASAVVSMGLPSAPAWTSKFATFVSSGAGSPETTPDGASASATSSGLDTEASSSLSAEVGTTIFVLPSTALPKGTASVVTSSLAQSGVSASPVSSSLGSPASASSAASPSASPHAAGDAGLSGGQIAGASVGSVAGAAALAALLCWWLFGRPPHRPFERN